MTFSVRHMKIHEKDPASGLLPVSPPSPNKRRRPSVKRRQEEENSEEPPTKKVCSQTHTQILYLHMMTLYYYTKFKGSEFTESV